MVSRVAFVAVGDWDFEYMLPRQLREQPKPMKVPSNFRRWVNIKTVFKQFYQTKYGQSKLSGIHTQWPIGHSEQMISDMKN